MGVKETSSLKAEMYNSIFADTRLTKNHASSAFTTDPQATSSRTPLSSH